MIGLVIKNTGYLLVGEALRPVLSFAFFAYLARELGVEAVGVYGIILAFTYFFEMLATLGLPHVVTRSIAVDASTGRELLHASSMLGGGVSLALWPLAWGLLAALNYPETILHGSLVLLISLPFVAFLRFSQAALEGVGRIRERSFITILENAGRVACGFLVLTLGFGIIGIVWSIVASRVFVAAVAYRQVGKGLPDSPSEPAPKRLSPSFLLSEAWPILAMTLVSSAYWQVDIVMLSKLSTEHETGLYNAALRYVELLKTASYTFLVALYPMLSASFGPSTKAIRDLMGVSIKYLSAVMIPICTGVALLAPQIVSLSFGREFADAAELLRVLVWTCALFPIALVYAKSLVAAHRQREDFFANVAGLACNIVLNYVLIGSYGAKGASWATVGALLLFLLIQRTVAGRLLGPVSLRQGVERPALAALAMSPVTLYFAEANLLAAVLVSAVTYITVLLLLRTFSAEELNALRGSILPTGWRRQSPSSADVKGKAAEIGA